MGSHLPLATVYPDLQVPSSLAFGSTNSPTTVRLRTSDAGRVGSPAQAAVLMRVHARARRIMLGIGGSAFEERYFDVVARG